MPTTSRFLIAVVAEHVLILLVFLIQTMVPDTREYRPGSVRTEDLPSEDEQRSATP